MVTEGVRFRFVDFVLDAERFELCKGAERIEVQPKVLHLLRYLLENGERTVTKRELMEALWPDTTVAEGSLTSAVGRARRALGDDDDQIIRTVHRLGYRMGVSVTREGAETRQAADGSASGMSELFPPKFLDRPAIAVLPFDNLSGDVQQDYFADGISEDLITRLSYWRSFPVIARNSSFAYKGKPADVKQISRDLGARYVVEGSVRKFGGRVRITAQLIDATTGHHVWVQKYDREVRDVFELQDELSTGIVAAMYPELEYTEQQRVRLREPRNLAAWEAVLLGRSYLYSVDKSNAHARECFERAIEIDPYLVAGFYGLAVTHNNDVIDGTTDDPERSAAELARAAERCMALDDQDALSHLALSYTHHFGTQPEKILPAAEMALHLNPSEWRAYLAVGAGLQLAGRKEEALALFERGMRLSPRDLWVFAQSIAVNHFLADRYGAALAWAERSLQHRSAGVVGSRLRVASLAQLGRVEEARAVFQEAVRRGVPMSYKVQSAVYSLMSASFVERYTEALRKAGLL
jgi:pentatricopeptide repeat protein